jgi:hypothetical protein|tara:strand:+ start:140 stop:457 length:318 start_codon:yes stop_codon:yes gene_type:complete
LAQSYPLDEKIRVLLQQSTVVLEETNCNQMFYSVVVFVSKEKEIVSKLFVLCWTNKSKITRQTVLGVALQRTASNHNQKDSGRHHTTVDRHAIDNRLAIVVYVCD